VKEDQALIQMMNTIFGSTTTVYYEYGNEVDLAHGVDKVAYTTSWNAVIPQLKPLAPHGVFIGPVNFQINVPYLAYFVQHASPAPDAVSWHEYTCNVKADDATCIAKIDNWSKHIAAARAAIGSKLPIFITEYNWNPNPETEHDKRATNNAFLQQWQSRAIQVLIENHVFAACHYTWSNQLALAIVNDTTHKPTGAGLAFQHSYEQDIMNATSTATATPTVSPVVTSTATATPTPMTTATPSVNDLLTEVNILNRTIAQKGTLHITDPIVGDVLLVYIDATGGIQAVTKVGGANQNQLVALSADQFAALLKSSQS
jgi:hypothetical protein